MPTLRQMTTISSAVLWGKKSKYVLGRRKNRILWIDAVEKLDRRRHDVIVVTCFETRKGHKMYADAVFCGPRSAYDRRRETQIAAEKRVQQELGRGERPSPSGKMRYRVIVKPRRPT